MLPKSHLLPSSAFAQNSPRGFSRSAELSVFSPKGEKCVLFTSNEIKADASPPLSAGAAKRRWKIHTGEDNTMQISTQSRKRLFVRRALPRNSRPSFLHPRNPLAVAAPRFRGRLAPDRLGTSEYDWQRFLAESDRGRHLYSLVLLAKDSRLRGAAVFQSIACAAIALVLLWLTLYCKRAISHRLRSPIRFCPRSFSWPPWATTPSIRRRRNTAS